MSVEKYFSTARERYCIKRQRELDYPWPWTQDEIFKTWRFCHVHREDDKTTKWFKENVRDHLTGPRIVIATVIFRWFNRIETGEKIKDLLLSEWDTEEARRRLQNVKPLVTGAFMMRTPTGLSRLDGLLEYIDEAIPQLLRMWSVWGESLEDAHFDLQQIDGLGRFLSYEIVTDLRWTPVLQWSKDIHTWASAGPGCAKGLSHVFNEHYSRNSREDQSVMVEKMQYLFSLSNQNKYWPQCWKSWEMREVEHWACEYFKYVKAEGGERLKRRYRHEV